MEGKIFLGTDNQPIRRTLRKSAKTVIISRNAYDWQFGGAEKLTYNLAIELRALGYSPLIITKVPQLLTMCQTEGITTFSNFWLKNETRRRWAVVYFLCLPLLIGQYLFVLWRYQAKLVISGSRDDQMFASLAAAWLHVPTIWIDHADMKGIISQPFPFLRNLYINSLAKTRRVIVVSRAEQHKIFQSLPKNLRDRFVVINNGAKLAPATALEHPDDSIIISYIGRLEEDKGVFDLVKAAELVLKTEPNCLFWLAGKGAAEIELTNEIMAKKLTTQIKLLGHIDNVTSVLLASDLFVYPTHHDASPLAPVEALLAGVPVIATEVGGIPEIITEASGRLVSPGDYHALASTILSLVRSPELRQTLAHGAKEHSRSLEFGTVVRDKYVPVIEEALK
ncbi:MAG: glycosyltransferase family 4 protein [Candidatus Saccharimonadia bacterium]